MRWQHAIHGNVGPAEFIALAESTDLIRPLTDWTIRQALADIAAWNRRGVELRVAVNLSARVLQDVDFPERLEALRSLRRCAPASSSSRSPRARCSSIPSARGASSRICTRSGCPISIDDYGTGFSSLGYLRDLRVHALKLDKSFVVDLETRQQNRVIVESTVQMAHALGLKSLPRAWRPSG